MKHALDYGWGRPDPKNIKKRHFAGVLRYLGDSPGSTGKRMKKTELDSYLDAGLQVAAIWQETDTAMTGGAKTGKDEGRRAQEAARKLGIPKGAGIYFTADHSTVTVDNAAAYLKQVATEVTDYRIGLYGSYYVITGIQENYPDLVSYYWQTIAWSDGKVASNLHLYQGLFGLTFEGHEVDINNVLQANWGQFGK